MPQHSAASQRALSSWKASQPCRDRNALTGKMMMELHDIALELTSEDSKYKGYCALILRGHGTTFCSGKAFPPALRIAALMMEPRPELHPSL